MRKGKQNESNEYLYKIQEWEDHQYDPGYYTGGKVPHFLTHPGKFLFLGWVLICSGFIFGVTLLLMIIGNFDIKQLPAIILIIILAEGINTIMVISGIRLIRRLPVKQKRNARKIFLRPLLITITIALALVSILYSIYRLNDEQKMIDISTHDQFIGIIDYDNYFIQVYELNIKIRCSKKEFDLFDAIEFTNNRSNALYRIVYRWNKFNKNVGIMEKVIKLDEIIK